MTDVLLTDDVELLAEILVSPSLFDTVDADMVVWLMKVVVELLAEILVSSSPFDTVDAGMVVCPMKVVVGWLLAVVDNSEIESSVVVVIFAWVCGGVWPELLVCLLVVIEDMLIFAAVVL